MFKRNKDDNTGGNIFITLLGTFGLVSVFYGFEGIIDSVTFLGDNPIVLLIIGVIILITTGTIYTKLK